MAESKDHDEAAESFTTITGFINARIEVILRRYDCVPAKDIIEELSGGYEKDLLMKTRKIVFKFAVEKVKSCITDLEREAGSMDNDKDADRTDAVERTTPAHDHLDQWELVPRRKKKYFASDTLDLFKFYVGQTNVFPKSCVRKGSSNRPGICISETAIVEARVPIPLLERQLEESATKDSEQIDLNDSILDRLSSTPFDDNIEDTLEEGEIREADETVTLQVATVVVENRGATQAESREEDEETTPLDLVREKGKTNLLTERGTDTCTPKEIEMSLRKMREESSPLVKRYEFERFVSYMNTVLDEYNKRIHEVEERREQPIGRGVGNKITELEMGQAGLIDEMGRMKLDIADVDVRTARNTRDIGIHRDPPKDARKPNGGRNVTLSSIWDIDPPVIAVDDSDEVNVVNGNAYAGRKKENEKWQLPPNPVVANAQQKNNANKGGVFKNPLPQRQKGAMDKGKPNAAHGGARSKVPGQYTLPPNPKPQPTIIQTLVKMAKHPDPKDNQGGNVGGGKNTNDPSSAAVVSKSNDGGETTTTQQVQTVDDSWADDVSDDELINSLNDADTTIGAGDSTPDNHVAEKVIVTSTAVKAMAKPGPGATAAKPNRKYPANNNNNLAPKGAQPHHGGAIARQNVLGKNNANNRNRGKDGKNAQQSYADAAAKQVWETPKKRKRVKSINKKVGSLSGANVFPQCDLYVQGIAYSWNDSYEDVEERMYLFGEERDMKFAYAKAIPVRNDKTQIGCKITVNESDVDLLMDDDFWPENITVRFWHYGQKTEQQKSDDDGYEHGNQNN